jgi:hypothetical protein
MKTPNPMLGRNNGGALMEFSFSSLFWVPLILGTIVLGLNLSRALRVTQLCRDAGHMYAYGVDFSQSGNKNLLLRLANGLNITAAGGNGVIVFSTITYIAGSDCTAGGLAANSSQCPNLNFMVFTKRLVIGNAALKPSAFGTPNAADMDSSGSIPSSKFLKDATTRATGFSSLITIASGQYAYVSEAYFSSPDYDWSGFLTGTGVAARNIF